MALIVATDGIVATGLGAPDWLAIALLAFGPILAAAWLCLSLRSRRAASTTAGPPGTPARVTTARRPLTQPSGWPAHEGWAGRGTEAAPRAGEPRRSTRGAIGYCLLEGGPGRSQLAAGSEELKVWCDGAGLELMKIVHDTEGKGEQGGRPSLQWALAQIEAGQADTLVVTRLQDLSPSVAALAPLLRWFTEPGRALTAIDIRLDTSTQEGRLAAEAVAGISGWERERISARTRRGLEAARSRDAGRGPTTVADVPELQDHIMRMRAAGMTLQAIADVLNDEGVPTLRGGAMWRPSSVQRATGYRRPSPRSHGIELPRTREG
jgi:DNA invertase Pin-like site-specific DNA recombinase